RTCRGSLCGRLAGQAAQSEGQTDAQDTSNDRIGADQENHRQRPFARAGDQEEPKDHRERALDDKQPFIGDLAAKLYRPEDLDGARHDSPDGDDVEQGKGSNTWPDKGDDACGNAGNTSEPRPDPALVMLDALDRSDEREDTVNERKGAVQGDQGEE